MRMPTWQIDVKLIQSTLSMHKWGRMRDVDEFSKSAAN